MDVMNFYYTESSNTYGMFVIKALVGKKSTATNTHNYDGTGTSMLYYVDEYTNNIERCAIDSELGQLLIKSGTYVSVTGTFPNSFENYVKIHDDEAGTYATAFTKMFNDVKNTMGTWKSKGDTSSTDRSTGWISFMKLMYLRDVYRDGWAPDATSAEGVQYIITMFKGNISFGKTRQCNSYTLSFQTAELRDLFYATFKSLITDCKEFI